MFRALYGLCGTLASNLTTVATQIIVDDCMMAKLRIGLANGSNYTYLIVKTSASYEVLLTEGFVGNGINVARAQDGTTAQAFAAGTEVEFCMGDAAIAAMISERALGTVNITGSGIVTVTQTAPNNYQISAPAVTITSESDDVLVGGEFPNFILSTPVIDGCCD